MHSVKAKKFLGQHFLLDALLCKSIADEVLVPDAPKVLFEIGAGMGALTAHLFADPVKDTFVIEIDTESVDYLHQHYPFKQNRVIEADFLRADLNKLLSSVYPEGVASFSIIGNFPYNISSQILFRVLDYREQVPLVVGMFQKEVGMRIAAKPRNKTYGILSVFMQMYYTVEVIHHVPPTSFRPVPKVDSVVLRLKRNTKQTLNCDEKRFINLVKTGFNQRRKTLRNALKNILPPNFPNDHPFLNQRAEELSCHDFEVLASLMEKA